MASPSKRAKTGPGPPSASTGLQWKREALPECLRYDATFFYRLGDTSGSSGTWDEGSASASVAAAAAAAAAGGATGGGGAQQATTNDAGGSAAALLAEEESRTSALSELRGRVSQVERAIDEAECKGDDAAESRLSLELDDLCKKCDAAANALFATRRQVREQAESAAAAASTSASASASTSATSSSDGKDGDGGGGGGGGVEANDRDPVLRIEQSRAGICSTVWDSSIVLGRFFEEEDRRRPGCFRGQRVLELGAGCGLTGIVLARLGAHVVFTDLEPASIDLLERNALRNLGPSSSTVAAAAAAAAGEEGSGGEEEGGAVASSPSSLTSLSPASWRVGRLQWGDDKGVIAALGGPFDIVVGADIMYVIESVAALADTLVVACASSRASSRTSSCASASTSGKAGKAGEAGDAKEGGKVCGGEGDGNREGEDRGGRGGGRVYLAYGRNRRALESFMPLADPHFAFTPVASDQLHPMYQSPDIAAVCLTPVRVAP